MISATIRGRGPAVVLVHGVGFGPTLFEPLAGLLAADHCVLVPTRRGYGPAGGDPAAGVGLDEHVADLVALLDRSGIARARFVGVSGGASIVTALALDARHRVDLAIAHEPLVGPITPEIHARIRRMAAAMRRTGDSELFARSLAGPATWERMDADARREPIRWSATMRAEAPGFLSFAPSPAELRALGSMNFVTSVGERSAPARHAAAESLRRAARVPVRTVPAAGHLAHVDAPEALAALVREVARR